VSESGRLHRAISARLGKYVHPWWPGEIKNVVFVVGCPRSGTSVLGRILSHHANFLYLFEPRYIWCRRIPRLNVWGDHAAQGRLFWDASDFDPIEQRDLARWFHFELTLGRKQRLVEKLPLNVFRLRWLSTMFPDARFIHMVRNGVDVALSLEKLVEQRFSPARGYQPGYWGSNWNYLMFEDYAENVPELSQPLEAVRSRPSDYARALFVWLCCVWEGRQASREMGKEKILEVRYRHLVQEPAAEMRRLVQFLQESEDERMIAFARTVLHANSLDRQDPDPEVTSAIAGSMLKEFSYEV
jgi:hypothetical protein